MCGIIEGNEEEQVTMYVWLMHGLSVKGRRRGP
jgi:hypothetical protein